MTRKRMCQKEHADRVCIKATWCEKSVPAPSPPLDLGDYIQICVYIVYILAVHK